MSDYSIPLRNKALNQSAQAKKVAESWLNDKPLQEGQLASSNRADQRNSILLQNLLGEVTGCGADPSEITEGKSQFTVRGDEPVIRLDNALFALKAEKILPLHKLFRLFHPASVKIIMDHAITLKVKRG